MTAIKFDNIFDAVTDNQEEATELQTRSNLISDIRDMDIEAELDYQGALEALEAVLTFASDTLDDPFNPLIEKLRKVIKQYEAGDQKLEKPGSSG